jgi:glyoxylase-like metal-dependent hydrolase (beta-lactamase superfamily II)
VPDQWSHGPKWSLYPLEGEKWFGFDAVRTVAGLGPAGAEILLVPLLGHSAGHCGVAVRDGAGGGKWLLHCGDAYFSHFEAEPEGDKGPVGVKLYQTVYQKWRNVRVRNQGRLRELVRRHGAEVELLCSHDPYYFDGVTKGVPLGGSKGEEGRGRAAVT